MALAYAAFFELEKHLPVLAAANPFLGDPYDAFGSIALETAGRAGDAGGRRLPDLRAVGVMSRTLFEKVCDRYGTGGRQP
jgi:hypothetical protein